MAMIRRKRNSRAKNKIQAAPETSFAKVGPAQVSSAPEVFVRARASAVARHTLFNAELEEAIDIIARERVYRAMLARLKWRLLTPPFANEPIA